MSLYLWKTESTKLLKLSLVRVKLISISLVVAVLNSMSGGTGGLDALLPLSLICGYLCEASIKPSLKTSTIKDLMGKLSYFIQEFHINKLPLFIISCLPLAGAISIKNNGYKWWGIYENRPLQSIFKSHFSERIYTTNTSKNHLGKSVQSDDQISFSSNVVELFEAVNKTTDNKAMGESSLLSFPNIPYFYSLTGSKPYANIPIPWIDVTSAKSSRLILTEWSRQKPNIVIFSLLPLPAYSMQGSGFSPNSAMNTAFIRLNKEIIKMILMGEMLVVDSYQGENSSSIILALINANLPKIHYKKESMNTKTEITSNQTFGTQASIVQVNLLQILLPCRIPNQGSSCREIRMRQFLLNQDHQNNISSADKIAPAFELDYLNFGFDKIPETSELNKSSESLDLIKKAEHFGININSLIRFANYYTNNYIQSFREWAKD